MSEFARIAIILIGSSIIGVLVDRLMPREGHTGLYIGLLLGLVVIVVSLETGSFDAANLPAAIVPTQSTSVQPAATQPSPTPDPGIPVDLSDWTASNSEGYEVTQSESRLAVRSTGSSADYQPIEFRPNRELVEFTAASTTMYLEQSGVEDGSLLFMTSWANGTRELAYYVVVRRLEDGNKLYVNTYIDFDVIDSEVLVSGLSPSNPIDVYVERQGNEVAFFVNQSSSPMLMLGIPDGAIGTDIQLRSVYFPPGTIDGYWSNLVIEPVP